MESQADMNGRKDYFICYELFHKIWKDLPTELQAKYYVALMEFGLYWIEPDDPIVKSLLQWPIYSIQKSNDVLGKKSKAWKSHKWNQYTKGDTKWKAQKNIVEQNGTPLEHSGTEWKKEDIEDIEDIKENKESKFELFWKEFPHARKWKKGDSLKYFKQQDADSVMKQVYILKRKIRAWLQDPKYIPACERWIRDFTEISEDVINQDLYRIAKWHLNSGWDIKQRATELKQTFGEEKINEIVKAIQQKRITLSLN